MVDRRRGGLGMTYVDQFGCVTERFAAGDVRRSPTSRSMASCCRMMGPVELAMTTSMTVHLPTRPRPVDVLAEGRS